jgi:hypothetical protein
MAKLGAASQITIRSDDAVMAQGIAVVIKRHFTEFTGQTHADGSMLIVNPANKHGNCTIMGQSGQVALQWQEKDQESDT